jgi:hypothetical protein
VLVGPAVADHGIEDVGAAAGEAEQSGGVVLAFGAFAVVVGPAGRVLELAKADKYKALFSARLPRRGWLSPRMLRPD